MIQRSWRSALAAAACTLACLGACRVDTARYPVEPPVDTSGTDTTDTTGGGGTVQRATLTLDVRLSESDSTVARALELPADRSVAGATIVLRRGTSMSTTTATTDSAGRVRLPDLLPGSYSVSLIRPLTPDEAVRLEPADRDVTALGGGLTLEVQAPSAAGVLVAHAGRRGSLVISEVARSAPRTPSGEFYLYGHFLEIYNNSDTTIFLDRKTVGKALPGWADYPSFPCANEEPYRMDSLGIWAAWFYRFPGDGDDHPLRPGEAVIVASDAIDHTTIDPQQPDLSGAQFEFRGTSDVNNPLAADMISIGTRDGGMPLGHGLRFNDLQGVVFLADPVDTAAIPRAQPPSYTFQFARIPAERILDVLTYQSADYVYDYPLCGPSVNPRFDRQRGAFLTGEDRRTMQRKVASILPDGRRILLRTKTSARDFEARATSPFAIP